MLPDIRFTPTTENVLFLDYVVVDFPDFVKKKRRFLLLRNDRTEHSWLRMPSRPAVEGFDAFKDIGTGLISR